MSFKTMLVDCDGVLLDWQYTFDEWMKKRGYVQKPNAHDYYKISDQFEDVSSVEAKKFTKLFNESAAIGFLPPLRDSVFWIRRINEELGYRFVCITSLSEDPYAGKLRRMNLERWFGDVFEDVVCLPTGSDKHEALEQYRDSGLVWVEDKLENADLGHSLGLSSILLEHGHNRGVVRPYPVVKHWRQIHALLSD